MRHAPRERVSWNPTNLGQFLVVNVTLHVSVWVEMDFQKLLTVFGLSRSTWACELKCSNEPTSLYCVGHAPRERVSWNLQSRWCWYHWWSHAPRERVSWNSIPLQNRQELLVTLHVSVWVEIITFNIPVCQICVTLHVSVWVEIFHSSFLRMNIVCHAPRERVSWNINHHNAIFRSVRHAPRERVSWNIRQTENERISQSHAPRERVSWNCSQCFKFIVNSVTLHVSVWVEI